jgi:nicotinate-nucleotide adenylyltransferase
VTAGDQGSGTVPVAGSIKRIGVLGGTFDPVHLGHLALARFVRQSLGLDRLLFIPAARPPHKLQTDLSPFAARYEMLQLALRREPEFTVSDMEVARRGPSYSVDTLAQLHRLAGDGERFFFIIGLDAFLELQTWKNYRELPRLADLVVINRAEYPFEQALVTIQSLGNYRYDQDCSCWRTVDLPGRIYQLTMEPVEISSTMVRQAVAAGQPLKGLVPPEVARYIREHRLYLS